MELYPELVCMEINNLLALIESPNKIFGIIFFINR